MKRQGLWQSAAQTGLLLLIVLLAVAAGHKYYHCWSEEESLCVQLTMLVSALLLISPILYFLVIGILGGWSYREVPPPPDEELPSCTVVVPAYNEGEHIHRALMSLVHCDYPADKLEIIAINDGSIDDTYKWMEQAAADAPGRIKLVNCRNNGGKRMALYRGFSMAAGEVLVSVDSDSLVAPDAIRLMAAPFLTDERIGAVSGNVKVTNSGNGIFPPMIEAGFNFGFEFLRVGQSAMQSVFCTPGALSAYRADVVRPLLREWVEQTFFGHPAGIGEDRALTNLVLREEYGVVLQRSAMVSTNVPESYRGMARMFLRWERSNIRENLKMYTFLFKNFHWRDPQGWFRLFSLWQYTQMSLMPALIIWATCYNVLVTRGEVLVSVLLTVLMWATLPALINLRSRSARLAGYCYCFSVLQVLTLFWVVPYALFTVGNSAWLTRMRPHSAGKI